MLFLYRPPQTWMPFARPQDMTQQAAYNRQLQDRFSSTRTIAPAVPGTPERDPGSDLQRLGELHQAGVLTDAEFEAARARLLAR
jgi:hypothetical protein